MKKNIVDVFVKQPITVLVMDHGFICWDCTFDLNEAYAEVSVQANSDFVNECFNFAFFY